MNGRALLALLTERKITQKKLCEAIGIDYTTFYRKVNGQTDFTRDEISAIARELKLSDEQIIELFFKD